MQRTVVKPRDESRPWPGRPAADGLTARAPRPPLSGFIFKIALKEGEWGPRGSVRTAPGNET